MGELLRLLKPGTFMLWGLSLVGGSYYAWDNSTPASSLLARVAFPAMLVSWAAGMILIIRVRSRGPD